MRKTILLPAFIITLALLNMFAAAGSAQGTDRTVVIDDAGIFENRIGEVEAAAQKLMDQGADVRVRTIQNFGSAGNLDQYELQLESASPSWKGQSNDLKNNMIVLIVALQEQQVGLYYGYLWLDILNNNWTRIQTTIMSPLFKNGDYASGVVQGLAEIQRLVQGKVQTPTTTQQTTPAPQTSPIATSQAQGGTGNSSGWIIPVIIIVIIALIVGFLFFLNSRKKQTKRQAARQKAIMVKQGAASSVNEMIERLQMLEIKVDVTADKVAPEEGKLLREPVEKARVLIDRSSQRYSELSHSAGDPENPKLGEAELAVIEGEYQKILGDLRQAREEVKGVEEKIAATQQIIDGFPGRVDAVNKAIEEAVKKQDELAKGGFKTVYPAELVAKGRASLEQAKSRINERRYTDGSNALNLASDQINEAIKETETLPQKKQEAESAVTLLASRIDTVKDKIVHGRDNFERIANEYAETTWTSIRGNGTEAENRVNWTQDALDDARSAIGAELQDWHQALEAAEKGNKWLAEAESFMKSISDLDGNLAAARRDAPNEINAAQADVTKAWDYINRFDEDIRESLEDDLRRAEEKNNLARAELNKDKPDYFAVNKMAREANEAADKILIQARDEHEAAERMRAKAISSLRDANSKVAIARKYTEDHYPVIQGESKKYLNNAIEALRQASAASDTNSQVSLATQAEAAAERAYSLAQRDVSATNVIIPGMGIPQVIVPPMSRPPFNTNWGSRRSSSPGSGSPGGGGTIRRSGGGSTSWGAGGGGGVRRGGGSTGW